MANPVRYSQRLVVVAGTAGAALLFLGSPVVATAAPSRGHVARVSADLQDHLDVGSQSIEILLHGTRASCDSVATTYNLVVRRYLMTDGCVLRVTAGQLAALRQDDAVDHISGDTRIQSSDQVTAESIGADQVWSGLNDLPALSGGRVTVAVIDSGIDTRHRALRNRVIAMHDFTGGDGLDRFGHGTHVAGIIAGQAVTTPDGGDYRGIAAGAYLVNLRVLDDFGAGTVSNVVDAIDWAIAHRGQYKIRILNLSLGAPVLQPYRDDPLCEAVERAVKAGLVVVAAAGNYGRTADGRTVLGAITSPANSPYVITVGAIDTHGTPQRSDDTLAPFSSRGPTRYDLVLKPDLAAPGSHIASAEAAGSYLAMTYPARHVTGEGANAYFQLSGTSMAAGVVSGAVALLLDERSGLRPADVKAALQLTSTFMAEAGLLGAGSGSLNVAGATSLINRNAPIPTSTQIADENVEASGLAFGNVTTDVIRQLVDDRLVLGLVGSSALLWGANTGDTLVWGNTLVWGATLEWRANDARVQSNTLVWGARAADTQSNTLVWGANFNDTLVWGSTLVRGNTLVWGANASDTLVLGASGNTLMWGATDADTLVWGAVSADTLVWGANELF
jgi:serine protease AprX